MNLGQLLAGQKGLLYKVANANEKALRDDKRHKIEQLRQQRLQREARQRGVDGLPTAWKSEAPIQVIK
jgi:hypothetical protein